MAYGTTLTQRATSLLDTVAPKGGLVTATAAAVLGSALLAVSAKVQVPFWPVPMTMQSMVVILLGMAYGSRLAMATVLLYLLEGLAGLPVFAGAGAGPAYMAGPTAGYLLGFVLAAGATGWLAERGWDRSPLKAVAALALGHALLFVPGVAWLAVLFGGEKAVAVGLTPFLAATVLKTALGAAIMQAAWTVVARRSRV
ncbi:biotin transporter BioY [Azospirillum rugosum]|uniref:Biotin transporter n=1 Tax=Azospirillum rugosum TaxID=416170 RepID=A0ABS4SKE2_9PROT|nr:biotin transporter BioY [Azospirillum rugosum]MBP2292714.1 biotin transport system substrate-specific component [Azospirillum rugosum]MDQ0526262.1 biotin transport system substrate-specific component [Azospirillum rugosum]